MEKIFKVEWDDKGCFAIDATTLQHNLNEWANIKGYFKVQLMPYSQNEKEVREAINKINVYFKECFASPGPVTIAIKTLLDFVHQYLPKTTRLDEIIAVIDNLVEKDRTELCRLLFETQVGSGNYKDGKCIVNLSDKPQEYSNEHTLSNCLDYCWHRLVNHPESGLHKTGCTKEAIEKLRKDIRRIKVGKLDKDIKSIKKLNFGNGPYIKIPEQLDIANKINELIDELNTLKGR